MKVLILGGTGAMGIHLVKLLSESGSEIVVTTRQSRESNEDVRYIVGNAQEIGFLRNILKEKWDVIIDFMVYSTSVFKERVELILNSTSQYIFLSSARVYADEEGFITEDSSRLLDVSHDNEFLATDEYSLSKARQEDILRNSNQKNWTIIRPYITFSENRLQLGVLEKEEWLYRALHGRTIVFSKDIALKTTTMTYGLDVSNAIMQLIGNQQSFGEVFHITTDEFHTWEEILNIYLAVIEKIIGLKPKVLLQNMDKFIEVHPSEYQINYDRLFNRRFDNSKIVNVSGNKKFTSTDKGLINCLLQFIQNPKFSDINWKLEAIKDKQTNERTPLKEVIEVKHKVIYLLYRYISPNVVDKLLNFIR